MATLGILSGLLLASGCAAPTASVRPPLSTGPLYAAVDWKPDSAVLRLFDQDGRSRVAGVLQAEASAGVRASLSPDRAYLAFTFLAAQGGDPGADGRIGLLTISSGEVKIVVEGADIRSAPVFSPDGLEIAFRKRLSSTGADFDEIWSQRLDGSEPRRLLSEPFSLGIYPVDWTSAGLRYVSVRPGESVLRTAGSGRVVHLDRGVVTDVAVSPDGSRIAFLSTTAAGLVEPDGAVRVLPIDTPLYGLIWPSGRGPLTSGIGIKEPLAFGVGSATFSIHPSRKDLLEVPAGSAAGGKLLVVRSLEAKSNTEMKNDSLSLIKADGTRIPLTGAGHLQPVGWIEN